MQISQSKTIYFIGIGGAGMSALAKLLIEMGHKVAGSDLKESVTTIRLKDIGATIYYPQHPANLRLADIIVYSTAISEDNPEYRHAKSEKMVMMHRAEMLNYIMEQFRTKISICGTHGKTTTSSMVTRVLECGQCKPTFVIGADLNDYGSNANLGERTYFVAESDESDGSFLHLHPNVAILTNLEPEHMDYYQSWETLTHYFKQFSQGVLDRDGYLIVNKDDAALLELVAPMDPLRIRYFGINSPASVSASDIQHTPDGVQFKLYVDGNMCGTVQLKVHGIHNVYNALAAATLGVAESVSIGAIKDSLAQFSGTKRRFQLMGDVHGIRVYDDYGHHPTEVATTLAGAKLALGARLICVFQPHRYTRTRDQMDVFPDAFESADYVVITEVYAANEPKIKGISGKVMVDKMRDRGMNHVEFIANKSMVAAKLLPQLQQGDVVITMGAGDISTVGKEILAQLRVKQAVGDQAR